MHGNAILSKFTISEAAVVPHRQVERTARGERLGPGADFRAEEGQRAGMLYGAATLSASHAHAARAGLRGLLPASAGTHLSTRLSAGVGKVGVALIWPVVQAGHRHSVLPDSVSGTATICGTTSCAARCTAEVHSKAIMVWVAGGCNHPESCARQASPCCHVAQGPL
jgi:hypothetical protein